MKNMALLIVDVQKAMIDDHPFHQAESLKNIDYWRPLGKTE